MTIPVYHGSDIIITKPSLEYGRANTDFGKGFYVTSDYEMAEKWACRKQIAIVNAYELDLSELADLELTTDKTWLDFVICNRRQAKPNIDVAGYDIITGATADDRMFATIELYEDGFISDDIAIAALNYMNISIQRCLKTKKALEKIRYIGISSPSNQRKAEISYNNEQDRKKMSEAVKKLTADAKHKAEQQRKMAQLNDIVNRAQQFTVDRSPDDTLSL